MNYEKIINKIKKEKGLITGQLVRKRKHCAVGCLLSEDLKKTITENRISTIDLGNCKIDPKTAKEISKKILSHLYEFGTFEELSWMEALNDRCTILEGIIPSEKDRKNIVIACLYARKAAEENGENVNDWTNGHFCSEYHSEKEKIWFDNFASSIINEDKRVK